MNQDYTEAFIKACVFTEQLGCVYPEFKRENEFFLDTIEKQNRVLNKLQRTYNRIYGVPTVKDFFSQCIRVNYLMRPILSDIILKPSMLTFGYVTEGNDSFFKENDTFFQDCLKNNPSDVVNIHAWLTLPSMEILDLTLCTTRLLALLKKKNLNKDEFYEKVTNSPDFGGIILGDGNNLLGTDVRYHPQVVGEDFMLKAGFVKLT